MSPAAAAPSLSAPVTSPPVAEASALAALLGAVGAAAADHDRQPGGGEAARESAPLGSGATEYGDSRGGQRFRRDSDRVIGISLGSPVILHLSIAVDDPRVVRSDGGRAERSLGRASSGFETGSLASPSSTKSSSTT